MDTYWADSSGRRNGSEWEVVMNKQKRRSDLAGRAPLPSPGRPPVAGREERGRFWAEIAAGLSSEDAAAAANVAIGGMVRECRRHAPSDVRAIGQATIG